jgi:hypothetical protein
VLTNATVAHHLIHRQAKLLRPGRTHAASPAPEASSPLRCSCVKQHFYPAHWNSKCGTHARLRRSVFRRPSSAVRLPPSVFRRSSSAVRLPPFVIRRSVFRRSSSLAGAAAHVTAADRIELLGRSRINAAQRREWHR